MADEEPASAGASSGKDRRKAWYVKKLESDPLYNEKRAASSRDKRRKKNMLPEQLAAEEATAAAQAAREKWEAAKAAVEVLEQGCRPPLPATVTACHTACRSDELADVPSPPEFASPPPPDALPPHHSEPLVYTESDFMELKCKYESELHERCKYERELMDERDEALDAASKLELNALKPSYSLAVVEDLQRRLQARDHTCMLCRCNAAPIEDVMMPFVWSKKLLQYVPKEWARSHLGST